MNKLMIIIKNNNNKIKTDDWRRSIYCDRLLRL